MNQETRAFLEDMGLELIYDYGFERNEAENKVFKDKKGEIDTDFWGFGNYYAIALKHMKDHLPDVQKVVDIGCCWGVFSHMFKEYDYVGLEENAMICNNDLFFRYYPHHQYIKGCFPYTNPGGDVFIASMSIGYGGEFYHNREKEEVRELFLEEMSKYKYGYMKASEWVEELLSERFEKISLEEEVPPLITEFRGKKISSSRVSGFAFWKRKDVI